MLAKQSIRVSALNIANAKESEEVYRDAIHTLHESRFMFKVNANTAMMITQLDTREYTKDKFDIYGIISRFTLIDKNAPWLNIENFKFASDEDKKRIRIPDNLKPNASGFLFSFNLKKHRLFLETYYQQDTLTPNRAEKFFQIGLAQKSIKDKHGDFSVSVVQDKSAIDKILKIERIKSLVVTIRRPNGDDANTILEQAEKKKRDEMAARNLKSEVTEYVSLPGKGIQVDEEIALDMLVSTVNGHTLAKGRDEVNEPVEISTKSIPREETYRHDRETMTEQQAFDLAVEKFKAQDNLDET